MLLVGLTMELLAGLGFELGIQPAGSLGMIAGSVLAVTASALVLRRQRNRPAARRIYLGLLGCVGVTALVLLVSSALNAMAVGAFLAPLCGIVVLVALMGERGHSGQYVVTWGFLGESRRDPTKP
jgi:membrane-associated HD superfamily phosphohydrolase